jgi:hypothetical protein
MKTFISLTLFTLIFACSSTRAAVRTLNNANPSPGQYSTFAAAQTASANGDTILVQGSATNYGTFSLNKKLTLIGTGHNPQKQAPLKSFLDYIYLYTGSNGSSLIGFEVYQISDENNDIDSVTVANCKITYRVLLDNSASGDGWLIDGNVFTYTTENMRGGCSIGSFTARNNVFNGYIIAFDCAPGSNYRYFYNNVFIGNNAAAMQSVANFYMYNNVFYRSSPCINGYGISATFERNISYQCADNSFCNGTNLTNTNPQFVNFPNAGAGFDYAYDFHIQSGSPAQGYGNDGKDLGVYGGTGDYNQNGIPRNPYISEFSISNPTISSGGTLNVNFKSKIR